MFLFYTPWKQQESYRFQGIYNENFGQKWINYFMMEVHII